MKILFTGLLLLISTASFSQDRHKVYFESSDGCEVEMEKANFGTNLTIRKGEDVFYMFDYMYDLSFVNFSYCHQDSVEINYTQESFGTEVMFSCNEHNNDYGVTKGYIKLNLDRSGNPIDIQVDGQKRAIGGFGWWKQEVLVECLGLKKVQ